MWKLGSCRRSLICPKLCNKPPFSALTMPLYMVFSTGGPTWHMESHEFGPWVQNSGFKTRLRPLPSVFRFLSLSQKEFREETKYGIGRKLYYRVKVIFKGSLWIQEVWLLGFWIAPLRVNFNAGEDYSWAKVRKRWGIPGMGQFLSGIRFILFFCLCMGFLGES
jgi:hypothetical protein